MAPVREDFIESHKGVGTIIFESSFEIAEHSVCADHVNRLMVIEHDAMILAERCC